MPNIAAFSLKGTHVLHSLTILQSQIEMHFAAHSITTILRLVSLYFTLVFTIMNVPVPLPNFEKKKPLIIDQCLGNIFEQIKSFLLIELILGPLYEVKVGIESIN